MLKNTLFLLLLYRIKVMDAKKNLNSCSYKEISLLFKTMLMLVEDMKNDHDFHYQKLYDEIPKKYHPVINTANHFDKDKLSWIRKRILDYGNESIRNMEKEIENYKVTFKFN
jgi:glucan phosphorylase